MTCVIHLDIFFIYGLKNTLASNIKVMMNPIVAVILRKLEDPDWIASAKRNRQLLMLALDYAEIIQTHYIDRVRHLLVESGHCRVEEYLRELISQLPT